MFWSSNAAHCRNSGYFCHYGINPGHQPGRVDQDVFVPHYAQNFSSCCKADPQLPHRMDIFAPQLVQKIEAFVTTVPHSRHLYTGGWCAGSFSGSTDVSCTLLTIDEVMTLSPILTRFDDDPFPADSIVDFVNTEFLTVDPPSLDDLTVEPLRTASLTIVPPMLMAALLPALIIIVCGAFSASFEVREGSQSSRGRPQHPQSRPRSLLWSRPIVSPGSCV